MAWSKRLLQEDTYHKAHAVRTVTVGILWKAKEGASPASGFAPGVTRLCEVVPQGGSSPRVCRAPYTLPDPYCLEKGLRAGPWPALGWLLIDNHVPSLFRPFKCGVISDAQRRHYCVCDFVCGHKVAITMKRHTFVWGHAQPRRVVRLAHTRLTGARGASRGLQLRRG